MAPRRRAMDTMDDIYGWRARIGLLYPFAGWVMEPEFYRMAPPGVTTLTARVTLVAATMDGLADMARSPEVERCTEGLATAPVQVICFGGTSASFLHGPDWDAGLRERMAKAAGGIPVTTTSAAGVRAFRAFGVQRIAFVGPYLADVTERGRRFFEASGFKVLTALGMDLDHDRTIGRVTLEEVYHLARRGDHPDAEAIFISCTGLKTIGVLAALERDLGKPVVSANQASFWDCLRLAGIPDRLTGFGGLFDLRSPEPGGWGIRDDPERGDAPMKENPEEEP
ncbi:MAG: maleate cis-trans isomerase family protein [Candidatus Rokuibacteriota bacterium]